MPNGIKRQEDVDEVSQLISKLLIQSWLLIDKMLPDQLGQIRDGLKRRYARSAKGTGLTTNFMMFLCIAGVLYRDGTMTMGELSRATSIPQSTATRMVRWMVNNGYVYRIEGPDDRRIVNIRLSNNGLELFLASKAQLREFAAVLLENLPAVQRMVFILSMTDIVSAWQSVQERQIAAANHSK